VVGGFVYVGSDNGNISKFNANTGALIWSNRTNTTPLVGNYDKMHSSPAVVGNVVYVGSENGKLYAMDATTGAVLWNRTTGGPILSSPAVVNNVVWVGSNDGYVYALNTADGSNNVSPFLTGGGVQTSPAVANGFVYVGSIDGGLYAINATTGGGVPSWPYNTGRAIYSSPAVANGRVYVGNNAGTVYCIDVNGTKIWDYTTVGDPTNNWIFSSPAVANGVVYIGGGEGNTKLYAIGNLTAVVLAPIASFTPSATSGAAPLAVSFTDHSTNTPTAWNWSFKNVTGNNTQVWFSTVQNPAHTFGVGNYSIALNASNSGGYNLSTQVTFINVTAVPAPVTNATATTGVYRPGAGFYLKMDNTSTWNPSTDLSLTWDNANGDLPIAGKFV
jgi:outer membrane protein assembly factor BamB